MKRPRVDPREQPTNLFLNVTSLEGDECKKEKRNLHDDRPGPYRNNTLQELLTETIGNAGRPIDVHDLLPLTDLSMMIG